MTEKKPLTSLNRRQFIEAVGGAAAAVTLESGRVARADDSQQYLYEDSFGNIVPAGEGAIQLGVYPPPIIGNTPSDPQTPSARSSKRRNASARSRHSHPSDTGSCSNPLTGSYYTCSYPSPNILMIIVDQMRSPTFWLPSAGVDSAIPNIAALRDQSFVFSNYFTCATVCGPARASLVTGLYAQQTCIFSTQAPGASPIAPPLAPYNPAWSGQSTDPAGFPTIGNVLSQSLPVGNTQTTRSYDCAWIGKWHLSCPDGTSSDPNPGANGPSDYGFTDSYTIPKSPSAGTFYPRSSAGYPSPNGDVNEGTGGDFLDSASTQAVPSGARDIPSFPTGGPFTTLPTRVGLNDAAIADAFVSFWLLNRQTQPWFCAVSFINPHDMSDFPHAYGLDTSDPTDFSAPIGTPSTVGYRTPPVGSGSAPQTIYGNHCGTTAACTTNGDVTKIPTLYSASPYTALPTSWNYPDNPTTSPYNPSNSTGGGKPGLQAYFQALKNNAVGGMLTSNGWLTFLNYYFWMQSCVDVQVGRVLTFLESSSFSNSTVILFTSDHGDYAGSHSMRAKGGGLYDEALNVPLYISYPGQRSVAGQAGGYPLPYVCSSVDILPYVYYLALGNSSWRRNSSDIVYHLRGREAINDAVYQYSHGGSALLQQRRISGIPLANPVSQGTADWQKYQPFVLHTSDEYQTATFGMNPDGSPIRHPSHALCFRTVDPTDTYSSFSRPTMYGGGKLGIYSYWDTCDAIGVPLQGINNASAPNEYEFYNFSQSPPGGASVNPGETLNQAFVTTGTGSFTTEAQAYVNDFFGTGSPAGISISDELYMPTVSGQLQAAITVAFDNYIAYLNCLGMMTGSDGKISSCESITCPPVYLA